MIVTWHTINLDFVNLVPNVVTDGKKVTLSFPCNILLGDEQSALLVASVSALLRMGVAGKRFSIIFSDEQLVPVFSRYFHLSVGVSLLLDVYFKISLPVT